MSCNILQITFIAMILVAIQIVAGQEGEMLMEDEAMNGGCHTNGLNKKDNFHNFLPADSYNDCLDKCRADWHCTFFSYGEKDKICVHFTNITSHDNGTNDYYYR